MTAQQFYNIYGFWQTPPPQPPFAKWTQPYNSTGLCDYESARALVAAINKTNFDFGQGPKPMGGGVLAGDDAATPGGSPAPVGIFQLTFAGSGMSDPTATDPATGIVYYDLHLRFTNGYVCGAGSFLDILSRYPNAQGYAVSFLAAQAANFVGGVFG